MEMEMGWRWRGGFAFLEDADGDVVLILFPVAAVGPPREPGSCVGSNDVCLPMKMRHV